MTVAVLLVCFCAFVLVGFVARERAPGVFRYLTSLTVIDPAARAEHAGFEGSARSMAFSGLALAAFGLVWLEVRSPYYFAQDDVLVGEMPAMILGGRALFAGRFPDYDPYVLLGGPLGMSGGASLTYPITYLAYAIARWVLRDEWATADVFAALHLLGGYVLTVRVARLSGVSPLLANLTAVSWVLTGSLLVMGRGWHMVTPLALYLPALSECALQLARGARPARWALGTALVLGLAYQVGFSQLWVYEVLFFLLLVALLTGTGKIPLRRLAYVAPAMLMAAGLALPLLLEQLEVTRGLARPSGYGGSIAVGLGSMLLPHPLVHSPHPNGWGAADAVGMGAFYYVGFVPALGALASLASCVVVRTRAAFGSAIFGLVAVVAFLLALGRDSFLWGWLAELPIFGSIQNNPFRVMPYLAFALLMGGAVALEGLSSFVADRHACAARWAIALAVLAPLAVHVASAHTSFYSYGFRPYPPLPPSIARALRAGEEEGFPARFVPVAPLRSTDPAYFASLEHMLPAIYRLHSLSGYDPILESRPPYQSAVERLHENPASALRAYGVRYVLVTPPRPSPQTQPGSSFLERGGRFGWLVPQLAALGARPIAREGDISLLELPAADPLAFVDDAARGRIRLPLETHGGGMDVDLRPAPEGGVLTLAFLAYDELHAFVDGREVPIERDAWGRIAIEVAPGSQHLALSFDPGWRASMVIGAMVFALGALLVALLHRRAPRSELRSASSQLPSP